MWRTFGGRDALVDQGIISRASAYRLEKEFRDAFGCDVSELPLTRVFGPELDDLPR
jgi:hypothetical protein